MRILVVEDDAKMAELLRRGLTGQGHAVDVAPDGLKGLEKAQAMTFDVIVLDVMLPGMDGLHVAKRLRASGVRTPILMLTARDSVPDIVRGLDVGADDYLTKPFPSRYLLRDFGCNCLSSNVRNRASALQASGQFLNAGTRGSSGKKTLGVDSWTEFVILST